MVVREISNPTPLDNQTIVTVVAAGIGGSEYLGFHNPGIRPLPNVMGHGIVGVIASGERVAVSRFLIAVTAITVQLNKHSFVIIGR
jgi:NADPH:quinone reductase-like Zn-dependent oxidoreductase